MRWYRRLVANEYDGSKRRGPGRPRTPKLITDLVVRLANEDPSWGYTRIRGNLAILGHQIGRSTIARILAEHRIDPAPQRPMQWSTFLRAHWGAVCAADFFTVEVLTPLGLSRRHVLFVMDLETRVVEIAGIVADLRVRIVETDRSTYPDLTVVCGHRRTAPDDEEAIVNPTVLVEVLSDSTEADDRGEKFAHYRRIASLREYVLVAQKACRIEVYHREGDRWVLTEHGPGAEVELGSIGARIAVDDVYRDPLAG